MTYLHILKGEMKKLTGNRVFLLLLLFLALLCAYVAFRQPAGGTAQDEVVQEYLAMYEADPEGTEKDVRERLAALEQLESEIRAFNDAGGETYPLTEAQYAEYRRRSAYRSFVALLDREDDYRETLSEVILTARKNYNNYLSSGIPEASFVVRYQVGVVTHYTEQLGWDIDFPVGEVRGYDRILNDDSYQVFLLIALLVGAVLLLLPEKSGMLLLLRSTKGGRGTTIAAKMTVGALMSLVLTLFFALIPATVYIVREGLAGGLLPLQYVFVTAPYRTTVLGGLFLRLAVQSAAGTVFVWTMLLLTLPIRHTVSALGAGGALIAGSYLLSLWGQTHLHNLFHLFNLLTILENSSYLTRWNAFYFGPWSVDYIITLPLFLLAALLLLGALIVWGYVGRHCPIPLTAAGRYNRLQKWVDTLIQTARSALGRIVRQRPRRTRICYSSIYGWEWRKRLQRLLALLCIAVFVVAEAQTVGEDYAPLQTYDDNVYHEYMLLYEGPWTQEKSDAIQAEAARLSALAASRQSLIEQLESGALDEETFRALYTEANDAEMRIEAFDAVLERNRVLRNLNEKGLSASFVYDTGWRLYLQDTDFDVAAAVVILFLAGLFADEYSGGFAFILRTTRHGRRRSFAAKMALTFTAGAGLSLLQNTVRLIALSLHYDLPAPGAPAVSISGMETLTSSVSVLTLVIGVMVLRALGLTLLATLTVSLSALCRMTLPTVLLCGMAVYLSRLLSLLGLTLLDAWTLNNLLCATPVLLDATVRAASGCACVLTLVLGLLAKRRET